MDARIMRQVLILLLGLVWVVQGQAQNINPEDGWWWNPDASGRGYLLERQGDVMFLASFHYSDTGEPEWLTVVGTYTPADSTSSDIGTLSGSVYYYTDGQCIGCDYSEPIASVSTLDPATVIFHDNQNATLSWTGETVSISRTFWDFYNNLDQLYGQWAMTTMQPEGDPQVALISIESNGSDVLADESTASINDGNGELIGEITRIEGELYLSMNDLSEDLPIIVPETKRFYAGFRTLDAEAVIAMRIDDLPVGTATESAATPMEGVDPSLFLADALVQPITTESCTLSGGTQTTCYRIEIKGEPADQEIGPFCPRTTSDTAAEAGIWLDGGSEVYDVDGAFILNLAELYNDPNWLLYDPDTGLVNVTDTLEACEAAARPDVDPQYQNHCVECSIDDMGGGVTSTILLPTEPVHLSSPSSLGRGDIGVTLNGVVIAPPAPVDAILGAYTIAAFDDCGGHVNPVAGYHYHAATGCTELVEQSDDHSGLIGYIIDGYGLYGMLGEGGVEPDDLDGCRGHSDELRGYHYHAASASENMFIGCLQGESGSLQ